MATLADVRRVALSLPGAIEQQDHGGNWFNVGTKTFVVYGFPAKRWIFKLPKARQDLLFEARPDVFQPYRAGAMLWSYVDIDALSREEIEDFVTDAWTTVAPKKAVRSYLAGMGRAPRG